MNCPRCGHAGPDQGALLGICPQCLARDLSQPDTTESTPPIPDEAADGVRCGRYLKVKELGHGGMGEVWKAWDTVLGRWVALKFLKGDAHDHPRFLREAQIAGALTHPNIAAVYETGEADGRPYIALQYLEGLTLEFFPRKDQGQAVTLVRDAALAMDYAHTKGVIHRDLKPSNMMAVPSSETPGRHRVCIMDFGLARPIGRRGDLSQTGVVLGTPAYMSPEQANGEALDARTDVYGLGATLYDILSGRPPFSGRDVYEILEKIRTKDPWRLRRLAPDTPQDLETIVLKCLEKEPGRRYPSARALADDLTRYLEGKPVEARPPSVAYSVSKWIRRNSALSTAYAAVVAALVIAGVLFARGVLERSRLDEAKKASLEADLVRAQERERERERLEETKKAALEAALERAREREREAEVVKKALERSEGLRLAAHSVGTLSSNPTLSLLLAVEAGKRSTELPVQNALRSSLDALREIKTLPGGTGSFSRDGSLLVTNGRLWDARTGELRRTFPIAASSPDALSPDKRRLLTMNRKGPWEIWDADTGKRVAEIRRETEPGESRQNEQLIGDVPFTPDSKRFVAPWQDRTAAIIDVETGQPAIFLKGHEGRVFGASFSPDGAKVVTWSEDQTVRVWNAADGSPIASSRWLKRKLSGDQKAQFAQEEAYFSPDSRLVMIRTIYGSIVWKFDPPQDEYDLGAFSRYVSFSPDGKRALSRQSGDQFAFVQIHDLREKKVSGTLRGHQQNISSASFSPSGRWIVTSSWDRTARIWDAATATEYVQILGHSSEVTDAIFSPDEEILYTSTRQSGHLWHFSSGARRRSLPNPGTPVLKMALSPDGTKIASPCDYHATRIWDLETMTLTLEMKHGVGNARFTPDGRSIIGSQGYIVGMWDVETGERKATFSGHQDGILSIERTRTADTLISSGRDGKLLVWDVPGQRLSASIDTARAYFATAELSPDGTMLAVPEQDRIVTLYNFPSLTRRKEFTAHTEAIQSVGWSPDGRWLFSVGRDSMIKVWNTATAEIQLTIPVTEYMREPSFTPDSRALLVMKDSKALAAVELWDISEARRLYAVTEAEGTSWDLATTMDMGRFLVCSGTNAILFETRTGNRIRKLSVPSGARRAWFHPDGKRILFSGNGLSVVDSESGDRLGELSEFGQIVDLGFSPDGKRVVFPIWGHGLALHDVRAPSKEAVFTKQTRGQVFDMAFSADGNRMVIASGLAEVWDPKTGKRLLTLGRHPGTVRSVQFSSDGTRILTICDKSTIMIWDAADGKKVLERGGAEDPINQAEFVGATTHVIAVHHDGRAVLHDERELKPLPVEASFLQARANPSGTQVLLLEGAEMGPRERGRFMFPKRSGIVRVWDLAQGREVLKLDHERPISNAMWIAEGRQVLTLEASTIGLRGSPWRLHLWDAASGKEIRQLGGAGPGVSSLRASRDGKYLFAGVPKMESGNSGGRLFDLQAGVERASFPPNQAWTEALFTTDGRLFITCSTLGQIRVHPIDPFDEARPLQPRELTAEEMEQYEVGSLEDRVRRRWESLDLLTRDLQTALAFHREHPRHEGGVSFTRSRLMTLKERLSEPGFQSPPPSALRQVLDEIRTVLGSQENLKKALDEVEAKLAALKEGKNQ